MLQILLSIMFLSVMILTAESQNISPKTNDQNQSHLETNGILLSESFKYWKKISEENKLDEQILRMIGFMSLKNNINDLTQLELIYVYKKVKNFYIFKIFNQFKNNPNDLIEVNKFLETQTGKKYLTFSQDNNLSNQSDLILHNTVEKIKNKDLKFEYSKMNNINKTTEEIYNYMTNLSIAENMTNLKNNLNLGIKEYLNNNIDLNTSLLDQQTNLIVDYIINEIEYVGKNTLISFFNDKELKEIHHFISTNAGQTMYSFEKKNYRELSLELNNLIISELNKIKDLRNKIQNTLNLENNQSK